MLDVGFIKFFIFEQVLVLVFVFKWDGGVWWCIDFSMLNSRLVKDVFFLFMVEECFDIFVGNIQYLKLDVNLVYW